MLSRAMHRTVCPPISRYRFYRRIGTAGPTGGAIRFFPDGSSTGGEIMLAGAAGTFFVRVDWLTGRIRIDEGETAAP